MSDSPVIQRRPTPLGSRGEPMIWLTGVALVVAAGMIVALLAIVIAGGIGTFWPAPIDRVSLADGSDFLGIPVRDESYDPGALQRAHLARAAEAGDIPASSLDDSGLPLRRLYRVGNKEILGQPFRWVDLSQIRETTRPADAVLLERTEWGVWIGIPEAIILREEKAIPAEQAAALPPTGAETTRWGQRRVERTILDPAPRPDGTLRILQRTYLAEGADATLALFRELHPEAASRRRAMDALRRHDVGRINRDIESERIALRAAELRVEKGKADPASLDAARRRYEQRTAELRDRYAEVLARINEIAAEDDKYRIVVRDPSQDAFAPTSRSERAEPMRLSQVVRLVPANALSTAGKLRVYASRWWEYLSDNPREANTEGGVFPVIFGTVTLTLLLSVLVVPLGVIAALYLREYARQGLVVSAVRIAVNNLAGVPSIVYGVFGLGFFCYTLGAYIDAGPSTPWAPWPWTLGVMGLILAIGATAVVQSYSRPIPGRPETARHRVLRAAAFTMWFGDAALLVLLLATTPFFDGFFEARLPTQTFGTKGILWSSLTLALLTLPVVIVATEEAISAVPRSLREASYGCGASKWQTIRRVVLPRAAPGIMTGMILAMARGAGEVAPLMLVGAVKLAPELPVEPRFPFLHAERSFMHLGFHIYDLGFQSPDSEAARPLVWTTTLLLITIIVVLNLFAIVLRARLRRRFVSGHF